MVVRHRFRIYIVALLSMLPIFAAYCVTKQERLSGITIKADGPEFDACTLHNGFNDCIMTKNGELFVIRMIRPHDFLVDVGAHVGEWSMHAFKEQPAISICCFEPIPMLRPKLKANLAGKPVFISNLALSNEAGPATFVYYPTQPHLSSLHRRSDEKVHAIKPTYIQVALERLDTFCEKHHFPTVNVMKIDVEGNEWRVMLGAEKLLEQQAIDVIQFEYAWTYLDSNSSLKEVYDYLTPYGFTLYRLAPWGLIEITEWRDALENFFFCNYVALRNE